jgi:hypothetical protein
MNKHWGIKVKYQRIRGMAVELNIYTLTCAELNKPSWLFKYIRKS